MIVDLGQFQIKKYLSKNVENYRSQEILTISAAPAGSPKENNTLELGLLWRHF